MKPTDIAAPDYFHKVVDCQWACPAHTPVPEYIRLIAEGRYSDAYMINWRSNVFPGILGRTCDRPCEPACRRGRVEETPVAICRLKRVAADFKDDVKHRMPRLSANNGKRIAIVGGGPASLTVARDLAPLGYHCTVFDSDPKAGGMMRTQIPKFRLPDSVIDEETDYILNLGIEFKGGQRIDSLKTLLTENFDAIFVGSGAPRGRELEIPGRQEAAANIHIGIDWLSSVSFEHTSKIGKRVIVLGGGNTAMDCCRTARRLGGEDVKVIVRSGFEEMKASPWEKEDALHEDIPILNFMVPTAFVHDNGKLTGVTFQKVKAEYDANGRRSLIPAGEPDQTIPCDDVLVAVGQENAFPWIERDCGVEFDKSDMPKVDAKTMGSTNPKVFFGGDAAFGPKNIIWAVAHGHDAALSIHKLCSGEDITERPLPDVQVSSQKMGIHEWSYDNDISDDKRYKVPHRDKVIALKDIRAEVELGYDLKLALGEARRCLNCDIQTVFTAPLCIECDACVDICPMDCITFTRERRGSRTAGAAEGALAASRPGPLCRRRPQDRARDDKGRRRLLALRPVRRTLSHRSLGHAEIPHRYDSRRYIMSVQKPISSVNDFVVRFANVNGSGSASANELFARSILRHGVPVSPRNVFPSNIQGLPTWYEVRVTEDGHLGARGGVDMMVAMNPQTWDKDLASIEPGGYLFYDSTKPMPSSKFRDDITVIGVPLTAITNSTYTDPRQRQLFKNIIYLGALCALLDMDPKLRRAADRRAIQGQGKAPVVKRPRAASRPRLGAAEPQMPDRPARQEGRQGRRPHLHRRQQRGRVRGGLWRRHRVRLVSDHAVVFARRRLRQPLPEAAPRPRNRQGEIRHHPGRGRTGLDRHRDRRLLERRARLHRHLRPRHLADAGIPRPVLFRRDPGRDHRRAARRPLDRHADAHPAMRHHRPAPMPRMATPSTCCCFRRTRPRRSNSRAPPSISPTGCRPRSSSCSISTSA